MRSVDFSSYKTYVKVLKANVSGKKENKTPLGLIKINTRSLWNENQTEKNVGFITKQLCFCQHKNNNKKNERKYGKVFKKFQADGTKRIL